MISMIRRLMDSEFETSVTFLFYLGFLSRTFTIHRTAVEGKAISVIFLYHFHPHHRHLDIILEINAESSLFQIANRCDRCENGEKSF